MQNVFGRPRRGIHPHGSIKIIRNGIFVSPAMSLANPTDLMISTETTGARLSESHILRAEPLNQTRGFEGFNTEPPYASPHIMPRSCMSFRLGRTATS